MEPLLEQLAPILLWLGIPVAFIVLVVWVFRPSAKRRYQQDAEIPFEEDESSPKQGKRD
jgi:cbb3-type cytochrome oxidase subunit 3